MLFGLQIPHQILYLAQGLRYTGGSKVTPSVGHMKSYSIYFWVLRDINEIFGWMEVQVGVGGIFWLWDDRRLISHSHLARPPTYDEDLLIQKKKAEVV